MAGLLDFSSMPGLLANSMRGLLGNAQDPNALPSTASANQEQSSPFSPYAPTRDDVWAAAMQSPAAMQALSQNPNVQRGYVPNEYALAQEAGAQLNGPAQLILNEIRRHLGQSLSPADRVRDTFLRVDPWSGR